VITNATRPFSSNAGGFFFYGSKQNGFFFYSSPPPPPPPPPHTPPQPPPPLLPVSRTAVFISHTVASQPPFFFSLDQLPALPLADQRAQNSPGPLLTNWPADCPRPVRPRAQPPPLFLRWAASRFLVSPTPFFFLQTNPVPFPVTRHLRFAQGLKSAPEDSVSPYLKVHGATSPPPPYGPFIFCSFRPIKRPH